MKKYIGKYIPSGLKRNLKYYLGIARLRALLKSDSNRFIKYSFGSDKNIDSYEQLEARITKAYHSIEKGLSYQDLRLGFGEKVLEELLELMMLYKKSEFPLNSECYQTALDNLYEYIKIHEQGGFHVEKLKEKVAQLGGQAGSSGGVLNLSKDGILKDISKDFGTFSASRHSVRDFSYTPVDTAKIKKALALAQNTPSACNRQGWKTRIITDPELKKVVEKNQNGNRGFGSGIDKYILITTDSQYFSKPRERNQPYIDGGMYAMNLLYSLHYFGMATISLSASLTRSQEVNIRKALSISESENFILFIGVGNYADSFKIPKSTRRSPVIITY